MGRSKDKAVIQLKCIPEKRDATEVYQVLYTKCFLNTVGECKYLTLGIAICTYNPQTSVTITCGIQLTGIVTMVMKVLHSTCNMCICDLPHMNELVPLALGIHIRQIPHAHVTTTV